MNSRLNRLRKRLENVYKEEGFSQAYWKVFDYLNNLYKDAGLPQLRREEKWPPAQKFLEDENTSQHKPEIEQFDVFLSYNHQDSTVVEKIAKQLEERGIKVWFDRWQILPGQTIETAIQQIISSVQAVIIFIRGKLSPWQDEEIRFMVSRAVQKEVFIIPVILPTADVECDIPYFLRDIQWVKLTGTDDPEGLDKLVWGITGKIPKNQKIKG